VRPYVEKFLHCHRIAVASLRAPRRGAGPFTPRQARLVPSSLSLTRKMFLDDRHAPPTDGVTHASLWLRAGPGGRGPGGVVALTQCLEALITDSASRPEASPPQSTPVPPNSNEVLHEKRAAQGWMITASPTVRVRIGRRRWARPRKYAWKKRKDRIDCAGSTRVATFLSLFTSYLFVL
jgi:hypothetical protein